MAASTARRRPAQRRRRQRGWLAWRQGLIAAIWAADPTPLASSETIGRRVRAHGLALTCFALLTAIVSWPMVGHFTTAVVSDGGDALQNYWSYWWLGEAILSARNPFETPLLYAPYGAPLYLHTLAPLNGLLSLPLQLLFGTTVAFNALVFFLLVLAAYSAYLLVAHLSGNRGAGLVGGVIFAFGSFHMTHLLGHTNLLTTGWIPLAALCFLRALETSGRRRTGFVLALAVCLLLLALSEWQYVVFTLLLLALLAGWFAATRRSLAPLLIAASGVGLWALAVSPLLIATVGEMRGGLVSPPDAGAARIYSADVMSFILPAERHVVWGEWAAKARLRLPAPPVEGDVFLGFLPLVLGLWALLFARRRAAPWVAIGLIFAVLALGPILHWNGDWRWDGPNGTLRTIPMPYALMQSLPVLNFLRVPIRMSVMVTLALAVLGGLAIAQMARRWPALGRPARAVPLVALLAALLVAEHLAIPFPLEETTVPRFYRDLAASPEQGTILEWPLSFKRARSNFYQTVHHRPIVGGYVSRRLAYPVRAIPPFRDLPDPDSDIYSQPADAQNIGPWVLQWLGVRWIVVYLDDPGYSEQDLVTLQAAHAAGPPIYRDETMVVLRPRPPVGTATAILGGDGWYGPERLSSGKTNIRWFASAAQFTVWHFGSAEASYALRFDAWSFYQPRRLEVWLDGQRLGEWRVVETQRFDLPITLGQGMHRIELRTLDPPISPVAAGLPGTDTRALAFAISNVRLER